MSNDTNRGHHATHQDHPKTNLEPRNSEGGVVSCSHARKRCPTHQRGGGGVVADYLAELRAAGQSPGTVRLREWQLRAWCRAWPDFLHATRDQVVAYLDHPSLSNETLASQRAAITGFYDWLIATDRRHTANPVTGLRPIRRNPGMPRPIPDSVVAEALVNADEPTRKMLLLGRFAGLRAAEISQCSTQDLTADGRGLRVLGKGHKLRVVPAHPQVVQLIAQSPRGWLFPSRHRPGQPWRPMTISDKVSKVLPDGWTCHTLRHRFATDLYAHCHDLRIVQAALGHSSLATTARYLAVDDAAAYSAVAGLSLTG